MLDRKGRNYSDRRTWVANLVGEMRVHERIGFAHIWNLIGSQSIA